MNNEKSILKPPIKWVGGKTQILSKILSKIPKKINNYKELFLGGGSVLLTILSMEENGFIKIDGCLYAYDINDRLIYLYKNIQSNLNNLLTQLKRLKTEYESCGKDEINRKPLFLKDALLNSENYYYWIRNLYNNLSEEDLKNEIGASMFIFLNKTCFRGLYRVGPNGFNVPYGNYKKPEIYNESHLIKINSLIKNVKFECLSFEKSLDKVYENDFIYIDPPYLKENTKSFDTYVYGGFTLKEHNLLYSMCKTLYSKKVFFMLSNSNMDYVKNFFDNDIYNIEIFKAKRNINSKYPQSTCDELLIINY